MKKILYACLGVTLLCSAQFTTAAEKSKPVPESILISAGQLKKKILAENLLVIDVRSESEYGDAHIPGAVRVDVGDWKQLGLAENGLRDEQGWAKRIRPLGISSETDVVVYGSGGSNAARVWWLLKYVGVKKASLLDGGWEWWIKESYPTENSAPTRTASNFKVQFQSDRIAHVDEVKKSLKSEGLKIVDTRSDGEFTSGRIPGSVQLEWKHLLREDGRFKSRQQLGTLFREKGIVPTETAVCY